MKAIHAFALSLLVISMAGCASTRSISNSDYQKPGRYGGATMLPNGKAPPFAYRGELNEVEVLGLTPDYSVSEADIQEAVANKQPVRLRPESSILLIQSGAMYPDGGMVTEMEKHFAVVPFSGVPSETANGSSGNYARALRLAAARSGATSIVCYWGILESANEHMATKTITWLPVVDWIVPDEQVHMRIRLKVAVIDVATGNWSLLSPPPFEDKRINRSPRREVADQRQVEQLKRKAYEAAVERMARFTPP